MINTYTVFYLLRITQSRSFLSKVRYTEGIRDEGTRNLVGNNENCYTKGSLYRQNLRTIH